VSANPVVSVLPNPQPDYLKAIALGGGVAADLGEATNGLVWTDSADHEGLWTVLEAHPGISWVQLPFAGVDNFNGVFSLSQQTNRNTVFTSAKGAYREPVAEHALMLALALARVLPERLAAKSWGRKYADTLFDSDVLIVGGGGIAQEIARLLTPFRAKVSVVRKNLAPIENVDRILALVDLPTALKSADFVFVASALTGETRRLFDANMIQNMKRTAYLINIARGAIVVSEDLEDALRSGAIAGAGIDVTDPEPLPDQHSLWTCPNLIITPHTADTPEMCLRLLSDRIVANVDALIHGKPLVGLVNLDLGY
jgi:phosphoglycerate dehydrogenase-like enzyme